MNFCRNILTPLKKEIPEFEWVSIAENLKFKSTTFKVPKTPGIFLYKISKLGMGGMALAVNTQKSLVLMGLSK